MTTSKMTPSDEIFRVSAGTLGYFQAFMDFQLVRTLGHVYYGGADVGEVLATAKNIEDGNTESYTEAFRALAERIEDDARSSLAAGHVVSAREAFLRASTYWRTAGFFVHHADPRYRPMWAKQRDCFREAGALFETPFEVVEIPYEDGRTLPAYFLKAADDDEPRPTLMTMGGLDTTGEELYFWGNGAAALRRGYNALLFEIPGQRGPVALDPALTYRHDTEVPLRHVCDWVLARPDVDPERLALIGHSMGGYFATRAVTGEHRIKACIANPLASDVMWAFLSMAGHDADPTMTTEELYEKHAPDIDPALDAATELSGTIPPQSWSEFLYRFGLDGCTLREFVDHVRDYTVWGLEDRITCSYLNVYGIGEGEGHTTHLLTFYDRLTCPKQRVAFTPELGAEIHCSVNNPSLKHRAEFDWLDEVLCT